MKIINSLIIALFLIGCDDVNIPSDNEGDISQEIQGPTALAGIDRTIELFENIQITGSATAGDGSIVDYEWKEDGVLISGLQTFTYLGDSEGDFTLTLTVVDENGLSDTDDMIITVTDESI
jgi:hypothetical protein